MSDGFVIADDEIELERSAAQNSNATVIASPQPHSLYWAKPVKKTTIPSNIGNYAPEICALTYPLIRAYARKIGADFHIIRDRKFPGWPIVYEKLQIYELAKQHGNEWSFSMDGDTLISPEMFDVTEHLHKNTICHNGRDMAGVRWAYAPIPSF